MIPTPRRTSSFVAGHHLDVWLRLSMATLLGLMLAAIAVASSEAESAAEHPRSLAEIRADGQLVVVTFPHQESVFSRTNLELGAMPKLGSADHFLGIDIDLMRAFADDLGVELMIRPVSSPSYGALIPDLNAGRGDLVVSSFTVTDHRRTLVDFSRPYFTVYPVIVTDREAAVRSVDDLASLRAAVTAGSSHEQRLLDLGFPAEQIVHVDFSREAYDAVTDGRADFTLADSTSAHLILRQETSLHAAFRLDDEDHYAVALPKGSELLTPLNATLDRLEREGRLAEIVARHMGSP